MCCEKFSHQKWLFLSSRIPLIDFETWALTKVSKKLHILPWTSSKNQQSLPRNSPRIVTDLEPNRWKIVRILPTTLSKISPWLDPEWHEKVGIWLAFLADSEAIFSPYLEHESRKKSEFCQLVTQNLRPKLCQTNVGKNFVQEVKEKWGWICCQGRGQ